MWYRDGMYFSRAVGCVTGVECAVTGVGCVIRECNVWRMCFLESEV